MTKRRKIFLIFFAFFVFLILFFYLSFTPETKEKRQKEIISYVKSLLGEKGKCPFDFYFSLPPTFHLPKKVEDFQFDPFFCLQDIPDNCQKERKVFEKIKNYLKRKGFILGQQEEKLKGVDATFFFSYQKTDLNEMVALKLERQENKCFLSFYYGDFSKLALDQKKIDLIVKYGFEVFKDLVSQYPDEKLSVVIFNTFEDKKENFLIFGGVGYHDYGRRWILKIKDGKFKEITYSTAPLFLCKQWYENKIPIELVGAYDCFSEEGPEEIVSYREYVEKIKKREKNKF